MNFGGCAAFVYHSKCKGLLFLDARVVPNLEKHDKIHLAHRSDESFSPKIDMSGVEQDEDQRNDDVVAVRSQLQPPESAGVYIIAIVAGISAAATVGLIAVGIGWYK